VALGKTIETARLRAGYKSKEAFVSQIGLSASFYNGIERGLVNITLETLLKIADGLGSSVGALCWDLRTYDEQRDKESLTLGKAIRETREARAMTPAELATVANIAREHDPQARER